MNKVILPTVILAVLVLSFSIVQSSMPSDLFFLPSGRYVSIEEVRRHHSMVCLSDLPHILFELSGNDLICSHRACLNMTKLAPKEHFTAHKDKFTNGLSQPHRPRPFRSTRVRFGNGYTFAFDPLSSDLITAWGPALHLHPLNRRRYPGVFVNAAVLDHHRVTLTNGAVIDRVTLAVHRMLHTSQEAYDKLDNLSFPFSEMSYVHSATRQKTCSGKHTLELSIQYDVSFCSLYSDDHDMVLRSLDSLEHQISLLFLDAACVRIAFAYINGICKNEKFRIVPPPTTPPKIQSECPEHGSCQFSKTMLHFISDKAIEDSIFEPDGVILFTGYGDNSSLGGATYRASACNIELSCAWIVRNHAVVIAHEIGHMLGAGHDSKGAMTEVISPSDPLYLSDQSKAVIKRFVELDSRSWCLRRQSVFVGIYLSSRSSSSSKLLTSATFASLSSESRGDLIIMFQDPEKSRTDLYYFTESAASCNQTVRQARSLSYETIDINQKQSLEVDIPNGAHAFSIGFGQISNEVSRDLILSFSVLQNRKDLTYYKVGYSMGQDGSPPKSWSNDIFVPNLSTENVQCSGLGIGHLRSSSSVDIVYAIIDRRNHRNVMRYTVGFNIGPDGLPKGGWTNSIEVPGWYGRNTSALSISLVDVDRDGQLELLVYHAAEWRSRKVPYLRVGRNLDKNGHVTGGWSKFVQGSDSKTADTYLLDGGMAATRTECSDVIVASISDTLLSSPSIEYRLSKQFITEELLETSEQLAEFDYFQDGCFQCYIASYAQSCVQALQACSSHVDEVHLTSAESRASAPFLRMQRTDLHTLQISAPKPLTNSIYCTGFHHLYINSGGCDITDERTVLAKGVEQSFLEVLAEVDINALINVTSASLHEDPAGVGEPSRKPTAALITVEDTSLSRKAVINKAMRKLQRRPGISLFSHDVRLKGVTQKNNRWYVSFAFKKNIFNR